MLVLREEGVAYMVEESYLSSSQNDHGLFEDMLLQLKAVAIDPCSLNTSSRQFQQSWRQILIARKILSLTNAECPQKKRQLDQLLRETAIDSDLPSKKPNIHSYREKEKYSMASPSSSLISQAVTAESSEHIFRSSVRSFGFGGSLSRKWIPYGPYSQSNALDRASPSNREGLTFNGSDDSFSGSSLLSPAEPVLLASQRAMRSVETGHIPPKQMPNSPRNGRSPLVNPDGSVSLNLASKKPRKYQKSHISVKLVNFDDPLLQMAIPFGPRFQADIPDLIGISNTDISLNGNLSSDCLDKWLGTRIWPVEGCKTEISRELIGKGRPSSCSCESPGSTECIKQHVNEKRLRLQLELSSAFSEWKFDEMGEEVSKSWTPAEEKSFEILVKMNPVSKNLSFWKPSLENFSCKSRESIVSYYFNVYVLRRMSRQTRLTYTIVDSDGDEANEYAGSCKNSKARYLTGLR